MNDRLVLLALVAFGTGLAPSQTMIKGHYIGEPVSSFVRVEGIDEKLVACQKSDAITISAYRIANMSDQDFRTLQSLLVQAGFGNVSRKKAEKLASAGALNVPDSRTPEARAECASLTEQFASENPKNYSKDSFRLTFRFSGGRVDEITAFLPNPSFDETVLDLSKRMGLSPVLTTSEMYNATGARWKDRAAVWLDSQIAAHLSESNNPAKPSVILIVQSRASYEQELIRYANQPSPLD